MIELTGKPGDQSCKIVFRPRTGFKRTHKTLERDLVYGHRCGRCMNVVQALFLTREPVDLWPYEETNVMSAGKSEKTYGSILKVVPDTKYKFGASAYTSRFLRNNGEAGQHIVLKNHVLKYEGIGTQAGSTDRYLEPGERPCEYTGVFSLREDLIIRDVCLFLRISEGTIAYYNLPTVDEFLSNRAVDEGFRSVPAYGMAPAIVAFPIEWVKRWMYENHEHTLTQILEPFRKSDKGSVAPF